MTNTPDQGIKNVIVKKELLGKVTGSNATVVRFRLVSEDKIENLHILKYLL